MFVDDLTELDVSPEDAHHLRDVLRLRPGADVAAADGHGSWRACVLSGTRGSGRGPGVLEPAGPVTLAAPPAPRLTVAFALTKQDRPEWTVQKLTELGIDCIWPLLTARTVVQLHPDERVQRAERLRRVARAAAAQSRQVRLPEVAEPGSLSKALAALGDGARHALLAEPGGGPMPPETSAVLVGPEGGWEPAEIACGLRLLDLGPLVLRSETAAVLAGGLLSARRSGVTPGA